MDGFSYAVVVAGEKINGIGVRNVPRRKKMSIFAYDVNHEYDIAWLDSNQAYRLMKILGDMLESNAELKGV